MTWSAALPGAALRVLRTAVGRRALQVVVLVGGLFALGFLCGERASAAEGLPTATSVVTSVTSATATGGTSEDKVLRPVTEQVVGAVDSVDSKVVQPVGDLVETVTDGLAEVPERVPPLSTLPSLPSFPSAPELPVVPVSPVQTLPAPVAETPRPDAPAQGSTDGHGSTTGHDSGKAAKAATAATHTAVGDYGPPSVAGSPATGAPSRAHGHRAAASAGYLPVRQAPVGDQGWALGHRPGMDNGSPRHGDAQAVSLNDRAPLRLVPGGIVRADADGTRDRHRDIPVSPA
ncbi:hypothetical protein OG885_17910 [Streptomyces sp. NBC_00028]|uniref:hypothetical protein n=1 Tax=Streptomyces sp. NBC_00028 TaxID=2975624 RepID=UPI0032437987